MAGAVQSLALAAALLASGCAAVPEGAAPTAGTAVPAQIDGISMQTNSWGRLSSEWRIERSGEGSYSTTERAPSGNFHEYDIVTRRFSVGPDGFARLRAILTEAERYAGRGVPCDVTVTDGAYGELRWGSGEAASVLGYNFGCTSRAANRVYQRLGEAEQLVEGWVAGAPVADRREVRVPR